MGNGRKTAIERMRNGARATCLVCAALALVLLVVEVVLAALAIQQVDSTSLSKSTDALAVASPAILGGKIAGISFGAALLAPLCAASGVAGFIWILAAVANAAVKSIPTPAIPPQQYYGAPQQPVYETPQQPMQPQRY